MSGATGGIASAEFDRESLKRQTLTVRCAYCEWTRTGPALATSKRGKEAGMLAALKRHLARHERNRASAARHYDEHKDDVLERKQERYWLEPERYREAERNRYRIRKAA